MTRGCAAPTRAARRTFVTTTAVFGLLAATHAAYSWGVASALRFVVVAVGLSFAAELVAIRLGLLVHHTAPRVAGVPLAALSGWAGSIYTSFVIAALVVDPPVVPFVAAVLATGADLVVDPRGVGDGLWSYPQSPVSTPRYRGVPWWNFAGWFVLTALVCALGASTA